MLLLFVSPKISKVAPALQWCMFSSTTSKHIAEVIGIWFGSSELGQEYSCLVHKHRRNVDSAQSSSPVVVHTDDLLQQSTEKVNVRAPNTS